MLGLRWLLLDAEPCVYTATQWNYPKLQAWMSHSCSLTAFLGPAAEGPWLVNKLVSFNIHNWWKEISRSVKMGWKGCVDSERGVKRQRGGWSDRRSEAGIWGALRQEQDCVSKQSTATGSEHKPFSAKTSALSTGQRGGGEMPLWTWKNALQFYFKM